MKKPGSGVRVQYLFNSSGFFRRRIESSHEPYKLEILESLRCQSTISIYHIGNIWWDLCAGPHVTTTKEVPLEAFDLTSIAGAYWKGDIKNAMLQVGPHI